MALKYKIKKLEDVAENLRSLYKAEGDEFVLDADGIVPKERLDEFRNNNITLQQQIDKFKGVDPQKYQELMNLQREIQEGELIKKGDVEGVVNLRVTALKADLEGKLAASNDKLGKANSKLGVVLIDNAVKSAALKTGVAPTAVDDIVLRARGVYQIADDGNPVPKNEKGEVIYGKDGTTPMPMDDWVKGLKETAPHLFLGASGGGAGGGGQPGAKVTAGMSPVDKINAGLAAGGLLGALPQG